MKIHGHEIRFHRAMLMIGVAFISTPALAQTAGNAAATPVDAEVSSTPDIVVTANRRAESVQKVPITVDVVTPLEMKNLNITTTNQLQRISPTITFTPSSLPGFNSFQVRGVGTFASATGLETSVGVAIDGVPVARVIGSLVSVVDLDRVEVLNGPQGTLFGKNASAGLISLTTRDPQLGKWEGDLSGTVGNYTTINTSGTLNMPLGEKAAARLSLWRFGHDGIGRSVRTGQDFGNENIFGGRLKLRFEPTDQIDIKLTGEYSKSNDNGVLQTDRLMPTTNLFYAAETAQGIVPSPFNTLNSIGQQLFNRVESAFVAADISVDLGSATLTSITSYRNVTYSLSNNTFAQTNPGLPAVTNQEHQNQDVVTQELRLTSTGPGKLQYVAGLFYYSADIDASQNQQIITLLPVNTDVREEQPARSFNVAAFAQLTYNVTPELRLIAGGRLSYDRVKGQIIRTNLAVGQPSVPALNGPGAAYGAYQASARVSDTQPSWRLGAQYQFTPDVMMYVTATHGYKGAGVSMLGATTTTIAATGNVVAAETATAFEAGLRSQFLDRRLTFNAAVFSETFKNFQVTGRPDPNLPTTVVVNAPELKSEGVDIDISARPIKGLEFGVHGAYVNARFTDFPNALCSGLPTCRANGTQDLAGWPLANSPKWVIVANASYDVEFGKLGAAFDVNYRHQSSVIYNTSRNPNEAQGGYGVLNLGVTLHAADSKWRVRAYVNNVLDKRYANRVAPQPTGYFVNFFDIGAFRTYGVTLDYSF